MRLALVHSPALGPSTWRRVADALASQGHQVVVPDLRAAAASGDPGAFVAAACLAAERADVVAGHSGAGPLLAAVAGAGPAAPRAVFVDAGLPSAEPDPFVDRLRELASDGVLPPWSTWFGPGALEAVLPDDDARAALLAEEPTVPLAFFAHLPRGEPPAAGAYLLLSDLYEAEAARARALGWPVAVCRTGHLGLLTDPRHVADALVLLARA